MRFGTTMNVPLAMPLRADHLLPERLGVEVGMVGLGADRGRVDDHLGAVRASTRAATSGNHWSQQVGKPNCAPATSTTGKPVSPGRK